jgi:DNA mismatch repair protein MutS2
VQEKEKDLQQLLRENERLKKEMQLVMDKEKHNQQVEILKQQNKISEEKIIYLKDTERKLKQMMIEWRKTEDKTKVLKEISGLLFPKNEKKAISKKQKQLNSKYEEVNGDIKIGDTVKMKRNLQVGEVLELRGKRAVVKIGLLPMQIDLADLLLVKEKEMKT